jgi:hypothetical protein
MCSDPAGPTGRWTAATTGEPPSTVPPILALLIRDADAMPDAASGPRASLWRARTDPGALFRARVDAPPQLRVAAADVGVAAAAAGPAAVGVPGDCVGPAALGLVAGPQGPLPPGTPAPPPPQRLGLPTLDPPRASRPEHTHHGPPSPSAQEIRVAARRTARATRSGEVKESGARRAWGEEKERMEMLWAGLRSFSLVMVTRGRGGGRAVTGGVCRRGT